MSTFEPLTLDDLRDGGYDTVIVCAPDMTGRLVGKRLTPKKFDEFRERGIALSSCTFGWDVAQDIGLEVPYTGWHTGWRDFLLIADLATLRPAAWLQRTAIVLADIVEEHDRSPVEIAPRQILRRQVEALAADGLAADVGTELEFHLYRDGLDDLRRRGYRDRTPSTIFHADYTVQQVNAWEPFFQRLRTALDDSGLDVEMSQGEWGLGQWEINLTYSDALDMCDRHTIFKLAVKDVAAQAGMSATFMPKPNAGEVGSSCHVHLSLRDTAAGGHPFFDHDAPDHMSTTMRHAIGGVLEHASPLMAWYAPTINSYRRTNSSDFAGHGATWAFDNRTGVVPRARHGRVVDAARVAGARRRREPVPRRRRCDRVDPRRHRQRRRPRARPHRRRLPAGREAVPAAPRSGGRGVPRQPVRHRGVRRRGGRAVRADGPLRVDPLPRRGDRLGTRPLLRSDLTGSPPHAPTPTRRRTGHEEHSTMTVIPRGLLPEQIDHIDGELRQPADVLDGASLCDPSTGEVLQPRRATAPAEVERAIAASARVHRDGVWADLDVEARSGWLERIAAELEATAERTGDAVAVAESTGSGVPIAITRMFAGSLAGAFRGAIAQLQTGWTRTELPGPVRPVELLRLPWGPAAILVPWNAPAAMAAGKVAMALAAGCPVLLKPPEWSPLGCNLLADAIHRVGLPDGVFQMVHGGPTTGAALTGDARVKVVSYTGSLAAGRAIARAAAEHFTALQLELGGNNPAIVRADADIEATAAALASGIVKLNGQWCEAPGKVLVARDRHDELVDALRAPARQPGGSATTSTTTPRSARSRTRRTGRASTHRWPRSRRSAASSCSPATCPTCPDGSGRPGSWWAPTRPHAWTSCSVRSSRCTPWTTTRPPSPPPNDTPFGLAGYVFSTDLDAAQALGRRIRFGEVKINGTSVIDLTPTSTQSFWGLSGIGGHGNAEVFRMFTGSQIVGVDHTDVPI